MMKMLNSPKIYWFIGQSGVGKTTLGLRLHEHLCNFSFPVIHINGDDIREIYDNKDYSEVGRRKNIEKAQDLALFLYRKGFIVVVTLVTPYKDQREVFKKRTDLTEIYLHTSDDRGKNDFSVENFEPPTEKFIDINTSNTIDNSFSELINKLNI